MEDLIGTDTKPELNADKTLVFIGSPNSGKSSLIHMFLERNEPAAKTIGLDYCYIRKSGQQLQKEVCHIWELGGDSAGSPMLATVLRASQLESTTVVLVVDLSRPDLVWVTVETLMQRLHELVAAEVKSASGLALSLQDKLTRATASRVARDHPDRQAITPVPIPVLLLAHKYDLLSPTALAAESDYHQLSPPAAPPAAPPVESRRLLLRTLRYLSHVHGAALYCSSTRQPALVRRVRHLLSHHAFSTPLSGQLSQDYSKPLLIPFGCDSLSVMFGSDRNSSSEADHSYSAVKDAFSSVFSQADTECVQMIPDDPCKDASFDNVAIDQKRTLNNQALDRLRLDNERRRQLAAHQL